MKFLWSIALGLAVSCFSGGAFGMFGYKTTEAELFNAIIAGDDKIAIEMIDKSSALGWGKATKLNQTTDLNINPAVDVSMIDIPKFSVTKINKATPLILAVWFNRSVIVDRLMHEQKNNKRSIGGEKEAELTGNDIITSKKEIRRASAIDVARILGNQNLVKKLIDEKIGSDDDIKTAQAWLDGIALKEKLKTLQESLTKLKAKLNQLAHSLQQLKGGLGVV